jgi:hypothetical protein
MKFTVIDAETGEYPDVKKIALNEEWAKYLVYCDIDGFAIHEDGVLMLLDDCGSAVYCPKNRFKVIYERNDDK